MSALAIQADNVGRTFAVRRSDPVVALRDVSLDVPRGELFGLLGPNGAGKTTLIKILVTLLLPTSGHARVAGFDVATQARDVRWRIAMVSGGEETGFGMLTLTEQLWMFAQLHGMRTREARRRIAELLQVVGLGTVAARKVSDLSTGMRQRLNLARGLLTEPEVLFLDEPT
ncbi:MAG: ABC transporter ATP-binding protein, partial [Acidimicrobiia bacterium]